MTNYLINTTILTKITMLKPLTVTERERVEDKIPFIREPSR